MIIHEQRLAAEPDTGRVAWVFRWRCSACDCAGGWLVDAVSTVLLGAKHARHHLDQKGTACPPS